MEICLDCKDKVVKFYHFKRRAREVQKQNITKNFFTTQNLPPKSKQSKVVHNIVKIVEEYSENCSISSIRIDRNSKKLIIESAAAVDDDISKSTCTSSLAAPPQLSFDIAIKDEPIDSFDDDLWQVETVESSSEALDYSDIVVKEEPQEQQTVLSSHVKVTLPRIISAESRRRYNRPTISTDDEANLVSKAALKMRAYRERLKKPENKNRYLLHLENQREWNRKHYIKKQIITGQPIRSRRRRTRIPDIDFVERSDAELFFNSQ